MCRSRYISFIRDIKSQGCLQMTALTLFLHFLTHLYNLQFRLTYNSALIASPLTLEVIRADTLSQTQTIEP